MQMKSGASQSFKLLAIASVLILCFGLGMASTAPRTITVCPSGCDYSSIQKAIDSASPGDTIEAKSGTYQENLTIHKSLVLRGAGQDKTIIKGKEEGEPVIRIESESEIEVTIEALTAAGAKGKDGLKVLGKAKVTIRNSSFSGNWDNGLSVSGSGSATIRNSSFSWNGYGLYVSGSGSATIENSSFSRNEYDGLLVLDSGSATIENSSFSGNEWYGLYVWGSGSATITNSSFSGNERDGLVVGGSGSATIENSSFSGNGWHGLVVGDSRSAEVRNSLFLENKGCGIHVSAGASVSGTPNEMKGNGADLCGYAPVSLRKPSVPQTTRTALSVPKDYPNLQEAIDAIAPGGTINISSGTYEGGLTIWKPLEIKGAGREETTIKALPERLLVISILAGVEGVILEALQVTGSKEDGLWIFGKAALKDILASGNGYDGLDVSGSGSATIENSSFSGNRHEGLKVLDSGSATIENSSFSGNGDGLLVLDSGSATIENSSFSGNRHEGLKVLDSGSATIENSSFSGNGADGLFVWGLGSATITNSSFSGNGIYGLSVWSSESATLRNSQVFDNKRGGILLARKAKVNISGNRIFNNQGYGVALYQRPCYNTDETFTGKVEGSGNQIPEKDEPNGNKEGALCPKEYSWPPNFIGVLQPPELLFIEFPSLVPTGVEAKGTISFRDPDGDISQAKFEVLEGALAGFTLDLTKPPYAEAVRGKTEGSFSFTIKVDQPGKYRLKVTLIDDAGLTSEPKEFSFEARMPTAPVITKVVFPSTIKVSQEQNGIVKFEDPDGDIVQANFEVIEGDPATVQIKPGMSFDPGVQGRTKGSFGFSVIVTKAQTVKLRLTLVDSAGLRSEPYEFTFKVE